MTTKDFFILLIKLFGLYSIVTAIFTVIPQSVSMLLMINSYGALAAFYAILVFASVVALFILLIFKSPEIVKLLKLEKGFDSDKLELGNLTTTEIIKIATIIIGGFLIIDNVPVLLNQLFQLFFADLNMQPTYSGNKWNFVVTALKVLIGYLLITNLNMVTRMLRVKQQD